MHLASIERNTTTSFLVTTSCRPRVQDIQETALPTGTLTYSCLLHRPKTVSLAYSLPHSLSSLTHLGSPNLQSKTERKNDKGYQEGFQG